MQKRKLKKKYVKSKARASLLSLKIETRWSYAQFSAVFEHDELNKPSSVNVQDRAHLPNSAYSPEQGDMCSSDSNINYSKLQSSCRLPTFLHHYSFDQGQFKTVCS